MVPVSSHCRLFFGFIAVLLTTPAGIGLGLPQAAADNTIKNGWDKPPKVELQLTGEERAWLEKHKVIRIAGPKAFPPFHYYTKDGTLNGMAADYMRYIADLLGVRVEVQANLKWPEVLERAQRREIDVISCAARAPDREAYLAFTDPYLSFPLVIISRKDASFIGGLDDLNGKKVAFIQKVMTYEWVRRDGIDVVPHFADTPLKALEAVSFGQVDAHIANLASSSYLMQKHGMVNLRIAAPTSYGNYNLYIAVRKDWPELVTIFNKVLNTIPPQQHTEIKNRWLTVRYEHGIGVGDILKYVLLVAGIAALILAVILVWNKRLQREIAERKQAETALQDSKERYTALFERSLDPVYIHDFEGNFIDANQVSLDLLGYSREETPSINLIAILGKDQVEPALETVKEIMETGSHKKIKEYRLKTKEGLDVWMETKASLIYKDGRPFAVQGVARDVTERKRVEQERENLIDDLQTALENIKTLSGLLPICASCKKIRDDKGYWNQIETYIEKHSDALFSHGICEECAEKLYGKEKWYKKANKEPPIKS